MAESAPATPPAAPARRRGWLRWTLRLVVALLLLVALVPLALHLSFVRDLIARKASEALGAPVSIGSASGWWTSGLTLEDVAVDSPPGHAGRLLHIPRLHAQADLFALLGGQLRAEVEVERPHATLRENADGRWNADDLAREPRPAPPRDEGGRPDLRLTITGGTLEAQRRAPGAALERVSGIEITAALAPDGTLDAALAALVEGAGEGGAPAQIEFALLRDIEGRGPLTLHVPALDLARVAGLLASATGLADLSGVLSVSADGHTQGPDSWQGKFTLAGTRLAASTKAGARLTLATLQGRGDAADAASGQRLTATLRATDLVAVDGAGPTSARLDEPEARLTLDAQRDASGEVRVRALDLAAGTTLSARATEPLLLRSTAPGRLGLRGKLEVAADLARLRALQSFVPALAELRGGALTASIHGRGSDDLDLAVGARVENLELAPGALAPGGYADRNVTLQGGLARSAAGAWTVRVSRLQSALAALAAAEPFELRIAPDGAASLAGPLQLAVSLEQAGRGWGSLLGLAPGERVGGLLRLNGTGQGTEKDGSFQGALAISDPVLPASSTVGRAPGPVQGNVTLRWGDLSAQVQVTELQGLGLSADGKASLERDGARIALTSAEARVVLDLTRAREHLGGLLGLERAATLGGRALVNAQLVPAPGGHELRGTTQLSDVVYRSAPGATALDERALTLEHTLKLTSDGALALTSAKARGNGYLADFSGSERLADGALRLLATLTGDAPVLAERVRALLGPQAEDLKGEGRVSGRAELRTRPGGGFAGATAEADVDLGTWSAAGATLAGARLTVRRDEPDRPLDVTLTGTLNGGTAKLLATLDPGAEQTPWTASAELAGVDVGALLAKGRASRGLAYVLPTLVPLDGATPALSGRLSASVALAAADLAEPALRRTLTGRGEVALTEGTLARSSLFGSLAGGGLGEVGQVLGKLAPEVGRELGNLVRSVAYQSVLTKFEVADQRVLVREARLVAPGHRLDLDGVVQFDERVDLKGRLWLGGRAGDELKKVLPDQTLPLRIRSTLARPQVTPDLKAADLLKAAGSGLLPKPKDVLENPKDALDRAKKELEDRLKGLRPK